MRGVKLILQNGPTSDQEYPLTQPETVIGRDPGADIIINAASVSRRHAQIIQQGPDYYIEDLNSSNGTFLNGQRLVGRRQLNGGDRIELGQTVSLLFELPPPAVEGTALDMTRVVQPPPVDRTVVDIPKAAPAEERSDPPRLVVSVAGGSPVTYPLLSDTVTIGRADDNDVNVVSPIVSRYHARLERTARGYQLVLLNEASNPIYYQDRPLTDPHILSDGDELRIGRPASGSVVTMRYQAPAPSAAASADATPTIVSEPEVETHLEHQPPTVASIPRASSGPDTVEPGATDQTMLSQDFALPQMSEPPKFMVAIAGDSPRTYTLTGERLTIGRAEDNDIVLSSKIVSRYHAQLKRVDGGYQLVPLPEAGNPVLFEGRPLTTPRHLQHEDKLRIGSLDPGLMVTMTYLSPSAAMSGTDARTIDFANQTLVTIGRDASNDVVLDIPIVSRFHAQLERVGQRYRLSDLRSANGTFVNDEQVEGEVWLKPHDTIRIGPYRFVMGQDKLAQYDESAGLQVEAVGLNKWVRKDLNILQDISLVFQPREFIVVVGQSGGGKSTLVDAIAGYRPATHGEVHVNGIDVYRNFDAIRTNIGFVPQRDIIHMELTVFQALDYAAQLRMPPDTTKEERHKRVLEVLEDLDLSHRKDVQISGLSGGQQKRVSIGVELLTKPGLFFLDEPTSGLDPGTETALMQLMRRLADQGRTIVLITHATKNVMLADKVAFLARGGYLAWFGPPDEALQYFDEFRSERDRRARDIEFDEIYAILDDPQKGNPEIWGERFRNHSAYWKYVAQPLQENDRAPVDAVRETNKPAVKPRRQVSSLRQFFILSARNLKILTRDRFSLGLMLAAAPLVSLLDVILASVLGRNPFDFFDGSMPNVLITLFLPTVYGVMVGGLSQMREIVKEQDIYKRERLVNLKVIPYIMSKIWVAALLALYQAAAYTIVHYIAFDMPGGGLEFALIYISLTLATMAGMMLGLFASVLAPNANSAPLIVILLMLPQIVLGGALVPLPEVVSAPTSTRWAFEAFMAITGSGSDVAADACWLLPEAERQALTPEFKDANCRCMGVNALNPNSCNFPGAGEFYNPVIDEPPPAGPPAEPGPEPAPPGPEPPRPELPPQPERPANEADQVAQADYFEALEAWQDQVDVIQADYEAQLADYQAEVEIYQAELAAYQAEVQAYQAAAVDYQTAVANRQIARASAVEPAEGLIRQFNRDFGWTFVNKENQDAYWETIINTWLSQTAIIGILLLAILVIQKRKDATK